MATHPDDSAIETVLAPFATPAIAGRAIAPFQFVLSASDSVRVSRWGNETPLAVSVAGLVLLEDGTVKDFLHTFLTTSDRQRSTDVVVIGPGVLLHLVAFGASNIVTPVLQYVKVDVVRGLSGGITPLGTLVQGYVNANQSLAWPGSPLQQPSDGPGLNKVLTGTDPAAGVEISEECPDGARWRPVSFSANLVCDATVTTRRPLFRLQSVAGVNLTRIPSSQGQAAGSTLRHTWTLGVTDPSLYAGTGVGPLPADLIVLFGQRLQTVTDNLQAGDNWAAPSYIVNEWLECHQ